MKYIVLECHEDFAVLLDEEGRFLKGQNLSYQVGQHTERFVPLKAKKPRLQVLTRLGLPLAAAACFALAAVHLLAAPVPYASAYLTINPQVRLDVDKNEQVLAVQALNADGEQLLSGYTYKDKSLSLATEELVGKAIQMGYLSPGGTVTVDMDAKDAQWGQTVQAQVGQKLCDVVNERLAVTIQVGGGDGRYETLTPSWEEDFSPYGDSDYSDYGGQEEDDNHQSCLPPDRDDDDRDDDGRDDDRDDDRDDEDRDESAYDEGDSGGTTDYDGDSGVDDSTATAPAPAPEQEDSDGDSDSSEDRDEEAGSGYSDDD